MITAQGQRDENIYILIYQNAASKTQFAKTRIEVGKILKLRDNVFF